MKYIEPDSIPELKCFPVVIYAMMAIGLIFAIINRSWGYITWLIVLVILGILGVYDFYLWKPVVAK